MLAPGIIDLRSDTLTVPDEGMRTAMARAEVGDDVWGEDPTVRRLEEEMALRLGKEAAVFVPSGTMGNLACVAAQTRPGDEVIADAQAHVVVYEVGGTAIVAGIQLRVLDSVDGVPDADAVGRPPGLRTASDSGCTATAHGSSTPLSRSMCRPRSWLTNATR
jgi:threonine aldolase